MKQKLMYKPKDVFDVKFFESGAHRYKFGVRDTKRTKVDTLNAFLNDPTAEAGVFVIGNKTFLVSKVRSANGSPRMSITGYDVLIQGYNYTKKGSYHTWKRGHVELMDGMLVFWMHEKMPPDVFRL